MGEYGCKVCRVIDDYGLEGVDDRLLEHWQADPSRRKGYRKLADWLNTRVLRREMDRAGLSTLGDEAASKYERLRSDDAIAAEVARDLADAGVPADRLRDDFVSYGVVRTHLTECLDASRSHTGGDSEWEPDAIRIARDHADEKIREAVRSLGNKDEVTAGGEISVSIDVTLECERCHARVPVDRALRRGYVCTCE